MSFEIKYDRDGKVISAAPKVEEPAPAPIEQVAEVETPQEDSQTQESLEALSQPEEAPAPVQQPKQETAQERNFKAMREKAERAERERDQAMQILREIELRQQQQQMQQQAPIQQEDDEIRIGPDDLAEGKHLSKVDRKIKKLEEQIRQYERRSTELATEAKLKALYPDFDNVVSPSNIEQLRSEYPELAYTLNTSSDLYAKAVSAYTLIKKLGIGYQQPQDPTARLNEQRIKQNISKPRSMASIAPQQGDTPLARANAFAQDTSLTADLKIALFKEMMEAKKNM